MHYPYLSDHGRVLSWTSSLDCLGQKDGSIIVVMGIFLKLATFVGAPTNCTSMKTTRLLLKHVVKY